MLGIGESRTFTYTKKKAKLFGFIPVKTYHIICGENLDTTSLHGSYYGNNQNNNFFAVQDMPNLKKNDPKTGKNCEDKYGKLDVEFSLHNYHYELYGSDGADTFYLGPQSSHVIGGEGPDMYILQQDGGVVIIDNYAHDKVQDVLFINVSFNQIQCQRHGSDLHIWYKQSHYAKVLNWFASNNQKPYQHMVFRSYDGMIFSPVDHGYKDVELDSQMDYSQHIYYIECRIHIIEKSNEKSGLIINAEGKTPYDVSHVIMILGSEYDDRIMGNSNDNRLDSYKGNDYMEGRNGNDTYMIRTGNGTWDNVLTTIDNYAADNKTDIIMFDVMFIELDSRREGDDLKICHIVHSATCVIIDKWFADTLNQHALLITRDHIIFNVLEDISDNDRITLVPYILDYNTNDAPVHIFLNDSFREQELKLPHWAYDQVITVDDSPFDDIIVGNSRDNFISCTGGHDYISGKGGKDKYVIKDKCDYAIIDNYDVHLENDIIYLSDNFSNVHLYPLELDLEIKRSNGKSIVVKNYFDEPDAYRHISLFTDDGIFSLLPNDLIELGELQHNDFAPIPIELNKDPSDCQCPGANCTLMDYDMNVNATLFKTVRRIKMKSKFCNYNITGNAQDNYIDPGMGTSQVLKGGNGSDTYEIRHGYRLITIDNEAHDNKTDHVKMELLYDDIEMYTDDSDDIILYSRLRHDAFVTLNRYKAHSRFQHMIFHTSDGITFNISLNCHTDGPNGTTSNKTYPCYTVCIF